MNVVPKLLLVDDRPENLVALEGTLRRDDLVILKAESGQRALELLIEHDVALALIDVQMPDMDGFQVAELMRGLERTREIPIIFVTAGVHDQARIFKGYESGAVDFLYKPLDPRILHGKVEVFLQLFRQKEQLAGRVRELEQAVRERRRAQEQLSQANAQLLDADRRKNEFLAVLSHELRNPLSPIKNSLYILHRADPASDQAHRAWEVIERQVGHLAALVNDLLDVTRITTNKITLQPERLELNEAARRAVEDNRTLFERVGVRLELAPGPEQLFVNGDPTRLAQVLGNLLQNAAKFTGSGGMARVVVFREGNEAGVRVMDTGVGIAPEMLGQLFETFRQAEQSLDRSRGGLGLGLALARGLIELHGGSISAHSEGLGKGSEFTFRLPLAGSARTEREAVRTTAAGTARRRVLIIEDNVDAADSLREVLAFSHEVQVAHSGPEGIAKAREFKPEVVLCDIGLPGMNGYEVARAMRQDNATRSAYLVALSGYALPEDLERAAGAGFQRHLAKPANLEKLEALLAEYDTFSG